jgi:hypothetical protein
MSEETPPPPAVLYAIYASVLVIFVAVLIIVGVYI